MSEFAPNSVDVTNILFKRYSKVKLFADNAKARHGCSLLASASNYGLVFAGTPSPILKVLHLTSIVASEKLSLDQSVPVRSVPLPSEPFQLALNCDHSLLAVDVVANGNSFIYVYSVPSFLSQEIKLVNRFIISSEPNVRSRQILWNPLLSNIFAVCLENGLLSMYTLTNDGFELASTDQSQYVLCACWSPKGKQIAVGHKNGKIIQYVPSLKPARIIQCPPAGYEFPYSIIALQWLSNYQFAGVFLEETNAATPSLNIINAPKSNQIACINYYDICYSQIEPRKPNAYLIHVPAWNILLMGTSNSMEIGILGTEESGDTQTWKQWILADEGRAELPLTADKQETYPIGFVLETCRTNNIVKIGDKSLSTLPMIHLLSTHGYLVTFNFINLTNPSDICSEPRHLDDLSGFSNFVIENIRDEIKQPQINDAPHNLSNNAAGQQNFNLKQHLTQTIASSLPAPAPAPAPSSIDFSFTIPSGATSTPANNKPISFFDSSNNDNKSQPSVFGLPAQPFQQQQQQQSQQPALNLNSTPSSDGTIFNSGNNNFSFSFANADNTAIKIDNTAIKQTTIPSTITTGTFLDQSQNPLITIPSTYTPPKNIQSESVFSLPATVATTRTDTPTMGTNEDDETANIIYSMIKEEIERFNKDLNEHLTRTENIDTNVITKEESVNTLKQLDQLNDVCLQAVESTESLKSDIRSLRLNLKEAFTIIAETKSKNHMFNSNQLINLHDNISINQTNRRQLQKLQNFYNINNMKYNNIKKILIMDNLDKINKDNYGGSNNKNSKFIPYLENIYETIGIQNSILMDVKEKLNVIKSKIGIKNIKSNEKNTSIIRSINSNNIDSITDSIISLSLSQQIKNDVQKLSPNKIFILKEIIKSNHNNIRIIKPNRPKRIGINSEVILEKKLLNKKLANQNSANVKKQLFVDNPRKIIHGLVNRPDAVREMKRSLSRETEKLNENDAINLATSLPQITTKPIPLNTVKTTMPFSMPVSSSIGTKASTMVTAGQQTNIFNTKTKTSTSIQFNLPKSGTTSMPFSLPTSVAQFGSAAVTTTVPTTTVTATAFSMATPLSSGPFSLPTSTSSIFSGSNQWSNIFNISPSTTATTTSVAPMTTTTPTFAFNLSKSTPTNFSLNKTTSDVNITQSIVSTTVTSNDKNENTQRSILQENKPPTSTINDFSFNIPSSTSIVPISKAAGFVTTESNSSIFDSIKVCSPTTAATKLSTEPATSIFGGVTKSSDFTNTSTGISFGLPMTSATTITTAKTSTTAPTNFSNIFDKVTKAETITITPISTATTKINQIAPSTIPTPETSPTVNVFDSSKGFSTFNLSAKPTLATTVSTVTIASVPIVASTAITTVPQATITSGLFANAAASLFATTTASSFFGGGGVPVFDKTNTTTTTAAMPSNFSTKSPPAAVSNVTNLFESNTFGTTPTATDNTPKPVSSIFGGTQSNTAGTTPGTPSIFGNGIATNANNSGGSIFKQSTTGNQQSGGSFFGSSSFGGSPTNQQSGIKPSIFGGTTNTDGNDGQTFGGSPFGGEISTGNSGASLFSSGGTAFQNQNVFSSPTSGGDASGQTVSPFSTPIAKPLFGGLPSFGSPPAFGGQATFGSQPTFGGSPVLGNTQTSMFGGGGLINSGVTPSAFGQPTLSPPTQQNSLFESLGASSTGMTFGNLAQNTTTPKQSSYQGSSFSLWRNN